jgi:hypothetical protein
METSRALMLGGFIGLGAAVLMAVPDLLPPALADDQPMKTLLQSANELWPPAFNPDRLVKWDYYVQPGISIEPITEQTVRKIGYGRSTFVTVMETESGVYSTDGLASPNIQYPGIVKEPKAAPSPMLWLWGDGRWASASAFSAGSFAVTTSIDGGKGKLIVTDDTLCVVRENAVYC